MSNTKRTYKSWLNGEIKSAQKEYTEPTRLLSEDGKLLAAGWARKNVFDYDRSCSKPTVHRKEWDFYQISNGEYTVQLSFANITLGGYVSAVLIDLKHPDKTKKLASGKIADSTVLFLGGKDKYVLPPKGDVPNNVKMTVKGLGSAEFEFDTKETSRTLYYRSGDGKCECRFDVEIPEGLENITTVLPFEGSPTSYFMTTKQNCMPCGGYYKSGDIKVEFSKENTFCTLDWGRVNTPYELVWYWGNGSAHITDADGKKHLFGFEITWGIGDESNATETAIFYDGKVHKFGAVDVEVFPKDDKYTDNWHLVSEDGRFDFVMKPFYDHHCDTNLFNLLRMHSHQVHGLWSGKAVLDDGTVIEVEDMYAFCEYVENKW